MTDLSVSEVFGPTFQGEGPHAGRRCAFVRLGLCNLDCAWCDTPYTWDWTGKNGKVYDRKAELTRLSVADVLAQLAPMVPEFVVVTGGEPLVQQRGLSALVSALRTNGMATHVETNGTIDPNPEVLVAVHQWVVSPKIANSGVERDKAWKPDVLAKFVNAGADFKVVTVSSADLEELDELVALLDLEPARVWVMPEGRDRATLGARMTELAPAVLARGYNLTDRLHVELWGDERGR